MFFSLNKKRIFNLIIVFGITVLLCANANAQRFAEGCSPDKPIKDVDGNCFSCDYPNKIELGNYWMNCQYYCGHKRTHGKSFTDCILITAKSLKFKNPCPDGEFPDIGNKCYTCDTDKEVITTDINCLMCGKKRKMSGILFCIPAGKKCGRNEFMGIDGKCYSCDTPKSVDIGKMPQNCKSCGNKRKIYGSSSCIPTNKTCKTNEIMDEKGDCYPCDYNGTFHVYYKNKNCEEVCGNLRKGDGTLCVLRECPPDKPLRDTFDKCHSCDTSKRVFVKDVESNCSVCPKRTLHTERPTMYGNTYCLIKDCPPDKPLQDEDKNCYACDEKKAIFMGFNSTECPKACGDKRFFQNGSCHLHCPPNYFWTGKTRKGVDECVPCDDEKEYHIYGDYQAYAEKICGPHRVMFGHRFIKACKENEFMDNEGKCYSCDIDDRINVTDNPKNCDVCPNRTVHSSNETHLKFCVRNCGFNEVKDTLGICHSCDEIDFIRVSDPQQCGVCPNRHIRYENRCTLNRCPVGYYELEDNGNNLYYASSNCAPFYQPAVNTIKAAGMAVMWGLYGLSQ